MTPVTSGLANLMIVWVGYSRAFVLIALYRTDRTIIINEKTA
jgi:hypothetical protein